MAGWIQEEDPKKKRYLLLIALLVALALRIYAIIYISINIDT